MLPFTDDFALAAPSFQTNTHALSCGTTDRDSSEVWYLQDSLDMIEDFQRRGDRREVAENFLVERQR